MSIKLADLTWPDVAHAIAEGFTTLILPLGATEQHGPHLPLGTDTVRAEALAERLAARVPHTLVAPALPFGCSDEHTGFAGLLGLDHETLASVIVDCARRAAGWGVRHLVVLSSHGGNASALDKAATHLAEAIPDLTVVVLGSGTTLPEAMTALARAEGVPAAAIGLHAGEGETSEMLVLRPELVRMEHAVQGCCENGPELMPRLQTSGLRAVTAIGVLGDPRCADASRGARYLAAEVESFRDALGESLMVGEACSP